jgi:hypothetical protein
MSNSQEAPTLIQYACERCKTRFVLPPSSRKLSVAGKFRAFSMGVNRAFKFHEGLGAGYDTSRRQLLAKMDDEAYQSFVQSFRFCHECRQFVCNECWSTSRRSCLTCVAKSMTGTARPRPPFAPTGPEIPRPVVSSLNPPRKGRMRRDVLLVALALMIIIVSLEAGILLVNAMPGGAADASVPEETIYTAFPPTASPTTTPTQEPTATAAPTDTPVVVLPATPSASPTPLATAVATARVTSTPRPTVKKTPTPTVFVPPPTPVPTPVTALDWPAITCSDNHGAVVPYTLSCSITSGKYTGTDTLKWVLSSGNNGEIASGATSSWSITIDDTYSIQLFVDRPGTTEVYSPAVTYPQ